MADRAFSPSSVATACDESEWRSGWKVVIAATAGFTSSYLPFGIVMVLAKPLTQLFGWSRAEVMMSFLIYPLVNMLFAPVAGRLIDRVGARRIVLVSMPVALSLASAISMAGREVWTWYLAWGLFACTAPFTSPVVWTVGVAGHFSRHRGKALGIVLCGTGIAMAISIPLGLLVYERLGWQSTIPLVCLAGFLVAYPLIWLFFRETETTDPYDGPLDMSQPVLQTSSKTPVGPFSTSRFWRLLASMILTGLALSAMTLHFASMLTDNGVTTVQAAALAALMGPSTIVGRLASAFLLDLVYAPLVGAIAFSLPIISTAILYTGVRSYTPLLVAAVLLGATSSSDIQMPAYLIPRFFGERNYGRIFSVMFGVLFFSMGIGPVLAGAVFDSTGSYNFVFLFTILAQALAAILMVTLGSYPAATKD